MSSRARTILAVVGVLVVALAFFFLFIRPRQSELGEVREQVELEEQRTAQLQAELGRLQDLQERAPELEATLSRLNQLIPRRDEVANFIFLAQDAANVAGVDFVQISPELPKPPPEGADVGEIRMTIGAGGGYFAIQDFIRRLHELDRAVRVDNLELSREDDDLGSNILFTSTARIFFEPPAGATGTEAGDAETGDADVSDTGETTE